MKDRARPIVSIAGRITILLFLFSVMVLLLYIQGNFQDFVDDSLIMLLNLYRYSALIFIAFAFSYILILIIAGKNTGRRILRRIIFSVAAIIFSFVFFIAAEIIITGLQPVV
ncbi:MAG: hypothetical protein PQJ61_03680 [Spirochaetales bacterium]|uniref:Uncharacterized protein n=1 Tax=Candidatus Thalassospirochaeta sargassi TaxID=3119039 RepID=A0AAJ1ICV5_9SPIO|nr:hypothetical protein [Spirochaetales bacterium]